MIDLMDCARATSIPVVGERIEAHPATDTWMRGDRFGVVVKIGRKHIHVKMDISGRIIRFHPDNILHA